MPANGFEDFPYLTRQEFVQCISGFMDKYAEAMAATGRYTVRIVNQNATTPGKRTFLEIQTLLYNKTQANPREQHSLSDLEQDQDIEDADPLHPPGPRPPPSIIGEVQYHVIYSPTWRVPTLYLRVTQGPSVITDMDGIRRLLIGDWEVRQAVDAVEFGGALGVQEHPELGVPFVFVHPCHTATMLRAVVQGEVRVEWREYLAAWMSMVGGAVGLTLPTVK
ncbi:hypothetical protein J3B02_000495 [Coemansia erecta]|uniref:Ubiquitin-like-conjugating enzyme ATG10 n=1 Tax=Coemansia asiatica TaxID=1052880 RepID=A0A9W8CLS2_9FUNG|nr:hypothetical protein LPJ64_001684 [Coemansia asiatica]KAJ2858155.1 hypothetical protein J3B02_000495 [Coemansia erecta]